MKISISIIIFNRPLTYRSLELTQTSQARVLSYVLPSLFLSLVLNFPKFLEAKLVTVEVEDDNLTMVEVIDYDVTELRLNPDYIYYYIHWTR